MSETSEYPGASPPRPPPGTLRRAPGPHADIRYALTFLAPPLQKTFRGPCTLLLNQTRCGLVDLILVISTAVQLGSSDFWLSQVWSEEEKIIKVFPQTIVKKVSAPAPIFFLFKGGKEGAREKLRGQKKSEKMY